MPTYDYECEACGYKFELFQSITEGVKKKCPKCKKLKLRRLFGTGAAIVFKGSGFYETDYRSESYKKGAAEAKKNTEKKSADDKKSTSKGKKTKGESSGNKGGG
ncbi:MAG: FmdB family zinc ribbon protein [Planctomycetota bacterium]|nr:FmdB family zinc ribbon protein [Planctomycetota bacterium]MEC8337987.1 FmdB family zinc ribbon protein [Planctomycetota bacterium]